MLYLGVVLSAMLYGICVLQSFFYFQSRQSITSSGTSFLTQAKRVQEGFMVPQSCCEFFFMIVIRLIIDHPLAIIVR